MINLLRYSKWLVPEIIALIVIITIFVVAKLFHRWFFK